MAEAERKPEIKALGNEIGVEFNLPFVYSYVEESTKGKSLKEIYKDENEESFGPTIPQLVAMRKRDGQARALYRLLTLPIKASIPEARFIPAEDGEEEAKFIEQVFTTAPENGGMSVTFQHFLSQLLTALFNGFAAFELVYDVPKYGPLEGKLTLAKIAHRPAETISFVTDENGRFEGFRQRTYRNGSPVDVYIPREYAFYYAAQEEERKFYGVSFFQAAFYHYDMKTKLYFLDHLAAQRAAVGTRIGTVPANASAAAKREFATNLGNLAAAQYMMVPQGFTVDILRGETAGHDFMNSINHHNSEMSKSMLAQWFDKDQGSGSNDGVIINNAASSGDKFFTEMIHGIMNEIADNINHYIIPKLIDWNFASGKYPKFTWGTINAEQKKVIATIFDRLSSTGQPNVTVEFMREIEKRFADMAGLDLDYNTIEYKTVVEVAKEKAAEQAREIAAQRGNPGEGNPQVEPETQTNKGDSQSDPAKSKVKLSNELAEDKLKLLAQQMLDEASSYDSVQ